MTDYIYTRGTVESGLWDINNPNRVDGGGDQIYLAKEVEAELPGKTFRLRCDAGVAKFTFDVALTEGVGSEKETLDQKVSEHKANV